MKRRGVNRLVAIVLAERRKGRDRRQSKRDQSDRRDVDVLDAMAQAIANLRGGRK